VTRFEKEASIWRSTSGWPRASLCQ
jgi:hypothetical protein